MSYQLVRFPVGGEVTDLMYRYDNVTEQGTYSLVQNSGKFRRSVDGVTWSDDYREVDTVAATYKLAFGAGKYAAVSSTKIYLEPDDHDVDPTDPWPVSLELANGQITHLHGSGDLLFAAYTVDGAQGDYSAYRTYNKVTNAWNNAQQFDFFLDSGIVSSVGLQNSLILDVVLLSSGLYAALLKNTGLTGGTTTTTSVTTTTTSAGTTSTTTSTTLPYPYNFSDYAVKIFSVSSTGAINVLYNLGFANNSDPVKLIQVRNFLYVVCPNKILTAKLTRLTSATTFSELGGTNIPTFTDLSDAGTNGRMLVVLEDDTSDRLHTYNPSTRTWTTLNLYQSARRPAPALVDLQLITALGQVYILDGEYDLYRSSNLTSWVYIKNTVIRDTESYSMFFANNRPFLAGDVSGESYLIVRERITKVAPTFVPKCN